MKLLLILSLFTLFLSGCSTIDRPIFVRSYQNCIDVNSCFNTIRTTIESKWHVPENAAKNGLQAKLRVHLTDDKVVSEILVIESSGNIDFDKSAIDAIRLAQDFRELNGLNKEIYEENFKHFIMGFKPD